KSVKNADAFASKIEKAELGKIIIREYEVELNDGVVLLIDYVPVFVDTIFHGHLWMFRDVTDIKHLEKQNKKQQYFYEKVLHNIPADIA
ncbi:hypothetical protein, partial [Streptomyces brasiliscabiei]|uniref:hypothetical protein n=1 Tax=Streptomyces brasiliscabiei TaxID=2736302 RepID=UPI0030142616